MLDIRKLIAEFIGTAVLVFVAVGTATLCFGFKLFGTSYAAGVVTTALAFGLVLMALVYAIGPISGCHVNPAVSLGFVVAGRMPLTEAIAYWVAQIAGGIAAAYSLLAVFDGSPLYSKHIQGLGADGYGAASRIRIGAGSAFAVEAILTFIFVMVILFATSKVAREALAGLAIGVTLVVVHLIGIPLTGTSVNPAAQHRTGVGRRRNRIEPALVVHRGPTCRWIHRRHGLRIDDPERHDGRACRRSPARRRSDCLNDSRRVVGGHPADQRAKRCHPSHIHPRSSSIRPPVLAVIRPTSAPGPGMRPLDSRDKATAIRTARPTIPHPKNVHSRSVHGAARQITR